MDREISQKENSFKSIKKFAWIIILALLAVLAFTFLKKLITKKGTATDFHIVTVEKGIIRNTFNATGTVVASSERVINSPVSTEIKEVFLTNGATVSTNDLILSLDKKYISLAYEGLQDELALKKNNIDKLKLQFDKELKDIDYQNQIKGLQIQELQSKLANKKSLLKIGGATEEEIEAINLQLSIQKLEKKMLENDLSYKTNVNDTEKSNLNLEFNIQDKKRLELKSKLRQTEVIAPQSGVITWINENIGETVTEGQPLVRIANLEKYVIEAKTSDRNSEKLTIGLPVELKINKKIINGTISRILPEITNNTIKFIVTIQDENIDLLRPNLRAELIVITDEKENVLRAKKGSALVGAKSQYIYTVENNIATKTKIEKGIVSSEYFEIISGVQAGDKIIISNTENFNHMETFEIN